MKSFTGIHGGTLTSNGSAEGDACVDTYARVCRDMDAEREAAHSTLKAKGVVAAGANDGWVDRKKNSWCPPSYAHIWGPIEVGSLIALGWPSDGYSLKTVTRIEDGWFGLVRYYFEPAASQG